MQSKPTGIAASLCWLVRLSTAFALAGEVVAQTTIDSYFIEADGLLVIEAESVDALPAPWADAASTVAPDINDPGAATGGDFISWEGSQSLNQPGNGLLVQPIRIDTPGTYRFCWRNQVGNGTSATDHNDTWLKIEADAFYGQRGDSIVCPRGFDPAVNDCVGGIPNGAGAQGWFKAYSSGALNWSFSTRTSDNDAHDIFARFDGPGLYAILLSARSSFHVIDRIVMSRSGCQTDLSLPESDRVVFFDGFEQA